MKCSQGDPFRLHDVEHSRLTPETCLSRNVYLGASHQGTEPKNPVQGLGFRVINPKQRLSHKLLVVPTVIWNNFNSPNRDNGNEIGN